MFFYDCDTGFVPDDGQDDVKDGQVENYPLDWPLPVPPDDGGLAGPDGPQKAGCPCEGR